MLRIDHINISAPYPILLEVKNFYCRLLNVEVGPRPNFARRGFWLYPAGNDQDALIHLTESDQHQAPVANQYLDHIAFELSLPEKDNLVQQLEQQAIAYQAVYLADIKAHQIFFKDPIGNGVEATFKEET